MTKDKSKTSVSKINDNKLTRNKKSKTAKSKTLKKSHTHNSSTTKVDNTNHSKKFAETLIKVKDKNAKSNTSDYLGVMALVAIMEPVTESQTFSRKKLPLTSCPRNK